MVWPEVTGAARARSRSGCSPGESRDTGLAQDVVSGQVGRFFSDVRVTNAAFGRLRVHNLRRREADGEREAVLQGADRVLDVAEGIDCSLRAPSAMPAHRPPSTSRRVETEGCAVGRGVVTGTIGAADSATLGLSAAAWTTAADAQASLTELSAAVDTLGDVQNTVGTLENRLAFAISLATAQIVNTKAAESRIRDANIAEESANLTRYNILSQSGIAALAQANNLAGSVLSLLR